MECFKQDLSFPLDYIFISSYVPEIRNPQKFKSFKRLKDLSCIVCQQMCSPSSPSCKPGGYSARDFLLRLMVVVSADHSEHQPPVEPRGLASGWPSLLTVVMETDIGLEQPRLLQLSIPLKWQNLPLICHKHLHLMAKKHESLPHWKSEENNIMWYKIIIHCKHIKQTLRESWGNKSQCNYSGDDWMLPWSQATAQKGSCPSPCTWSWTCCAPPPTPGWGGRAPPASKTPRHAVSRVSNFHCLTSNFSCRLELANLLLDVGLPLVGGLEADEVYI